MSDDVKSLNSHSSSHSLPEVEESGYIKSCYRHAVRFLKDEKWVSFVSELFGIASHAASMAGMKASRIIPYVNMGTTPFSLYYSIKESKKRVYLMVLAAKVSRASDFFFWGAKAAGPVGNTLREIIKPFAGGMALFGLTKIAAVGFSLSYVFPVILMVFSIMAGGAQTWSMGRTLIAYHYLKQIKGGIKDLRGVEEALRRIQPNAPEAGEIEKALHLLNAKKFKESHFVGKRNYHAIRDRIQNLSNFQDPKLFAKIEKKVSQLKDIIQMSEGVATDLKDASIPLSAQIDGILNLCELVLKKADEVKDQERAQRLIAKIEEKKARVEKLKETLYKEGMNIIDTLEFELGLKIIDEGSEIVAMAFDFAAGLLFLLFGEQDFAGFIFSMSGSTISASGIFVAKCAPYYFSPATEIYRSDLRRKELVHKKTEDLQ